MLICPNCYSKEIYRSTHVPWSDEVVCLGCGGKGPQCLCEPDEWTDKARTEYFQATGESLNREGGRK